MVFQNYNYIMNIAKKNGRILSIDYRRDVGLRPYEPTIVRQD